MSETIDDFISIEESKNEEDYNYFYSQIKGKNDDHPMFGPEQSYLQIILPKTEFSKNEEKIIQNESLDRSTSNSLIKKTKSNNKQKKKTSGDENLKFKTKDTTNIKDTKNPGLRKEDSNCFKFELNERKDNLIDKYWREFLGIILELCNSFCKKYNLVLKKTRFKQMFGSSIEQNSLFLELKYYKYLTYNTTFKDDKNHKELGSNNEKIIRIMIQKEELEFIAIMKNKIKDLFNHYIKNEKYVEVGNKKYDLPNFKTIDDIIEEKKIKDKLNNDESEGIKNQIMSLIDYINIQGKEIKRKKNITNKINYLTISELEDD